MTFVSSKFKIPYSIFFLLTLVFGRKKSAYSGDFMDERGLRVPLVTEHVCFFSRVLDRVSRGAFQRNDQARASTFIGSRLSTQALQLLEPSANAEAYHTALGLFRHPAINLIFFISAIEESGQCQKNYNQSYDGHYQIHDEKVAHDFVFNNTKLITQNIPAKIRPVTATSGRNISSSVGTNTEAKPIVPISAVMSESFSICKSERRSFTSSEYRASFNLSMSCAA